MSVAGSEGWKGYITQLRAPGERKQKYVVKTVPSLLCAARMAQSEKFLIPGFTVYNMQIIPFNQKFPCEEKKNNNLNLFIGHWSFLRVNV